jgi:hypothetical protein
MQRMSSLGSRDVVEPLPKCFRLVGNNLFQAQNLSTKSRHSIRLAIHTSKWDLFSHDRSLLTFFRAASV